MKMDLTGKIIIYSDGACSGNPGPGGWGAIVGLPEGQVIELSGRATNTTNNKMELSGAIEALRFVQQHKAPVIIFTDSTYVIRGITQWIFGWKKRNWQTAEGNEVSNKEYWMDLDQLVRQRNTKIEWCYVRGHQGVHGNERCDEMAVAESQNQSVFHYEGASEYYKFNIAEMPITEELPPMHSRSSGSTSSEKAYYLSYVNGVLAKDESWSQCEARVKGRPGAQFKKVKNESEEKATLQKWGISK